MGGVHANNTYPAEFIYENLMIQANVVHAAHLCDVQKLLSLGSSCIYPKHAEQPMTEDALLTGVLEATNEPYAVAKIVGNKNYARVITGNMAAITEVLCQQICTVLTAIFIQRIVTLYQHLFVVFMGQSSEMIKR